MGLARYSALNIYFFGQGQKIALPWGERWRQTAVARGSGLAAVLLNGARQRLVMAAAGADAGNYGMIGRDYAYTLNPAEGGFGRARRWDLYHGEEIVARFTRRPFGGVCHAPVPLPAVLTCLLLVRFGIPGENELRMPSMSSACTAEGDHRRPGSARAPSGRRRPDPGGFERVEDEAGLGLVVGPSVSPKLGRQAPLESGVGLPAPRRERRKSRKSR